MKLFDIYFDDFYYSFLLHNKNTIMIRLYVQRVDDRYYVAKDTQDLLDVFLDEFEIIALTESPFSIMGVAPSKNKYEMLQQIVHRLKLIKEYL